MFLPSSLAFPSDLAAAYLKNVSGRDGDDSTDGSGGGGTNSGGEEGRLMAAFRELQLPLSANQGGFVGMPIAGVNCRPDMSAEL